MGWLVTKLYSWWRATYQKNHQKRFKGALTGLLYIAQSH
jgi:hypothetical protein